MPHSFKKIIGLLFLITAFNQTYCQTYQQQIDNWHKGRVERLKAEGGWLNLTGLYWLKPGKNYFGSAATNQLVYKNKNMPAVAGYFLLENETVSWHTQPGVAIKIKNNLFNDGIIFRPDSADAAPQLSLGSLRWVVIKRNELIGIRLRDVESELVKTFTDINRYPVDSTWRFEATLLTNDTSKLTIKNVLGQTNFEKSGGRLQFVYQNKTYTLDAVAEDSDLFIIFSDATNGNGTYPAGRFVYAKLPAHGNTVILDFNKAYNPPCCFTDFATCPLPPPQNRLSIAITAGEKTYGHH